MPLSLFLCASRETMRLDPFLINLLFFLGLSSYFQMLFVRISAVYIYKSKIISNVTGQFFVRCHVQNALFLRNGFSTN